MSPERNGIFDILFRLVRLGLGGQSGNGKQFVWWIHEADFIRAVEYLIAHEELRGAINVCSPNAVRNAEFMGTLRQASSVKLGFPATRWMLAIGAVLLRTETELILKSRRVIPETLLYSGFQFQFPDWRDAAGDIVRRWRAAQASCSGKTGAALAASH